MYAFAFPRSLTRNHPYEKIIHTAPYQSVELLHFRESVVQHHSHSLRRELSQLVTFGSVSALAPCRNKMAESVYLCRKAFEML
jgi:hypothetical protein